MYSHILCFNAEDFCNVNGEALLKFARIRLENIIKCFPIFAHLL